jgi:polyribonucleotide nucleotidyltransferase
LGIEGNRIKLSRKAILREQRAKLAAASGGSLPDIDAAYDRPPERSEETITFEADDFPDNIEQEEPSFNREDLNRETVSAGGLHDHGDRPRGGRPHGGRRHRRGGRPRDPKPPKQ